MHYVSWVLFDVSSTEAKAKANNINMKSNWTKLNQKLNKYKIIIHSHEA